MAKPFSIILGPKSKGRPRGKPFQKGERLPYQFKPGQSGNPGGKPKVHQTLRKEYESFLGGPAPVGLCRELGLPEKSTFANIIAAVMCYRAVFSPAAAKLRPI